MIEKRINMDHGLCVHDPKFAYDFYTFLSSALYVRIPHFPTIAYHANIIPI